jgi:hypothetical protein
MINDLTSILLLVRGGGAIQIRCECVCTRENERNVVCNVDNSRPSKRH